MNSNQVPLGSIADIYIGLLVRSSEIGDPNTLPNVISVKALTGNSIDRNLLDTVAFSDKSVDRHRVHAGDVLLSCRSTTLVSGIVPDEMHGLVINSTVIGISLSEAMDPRLLVAWLHSPMGRSEIASTSQSGTVQMNLSVSGLSRMVVPIIPRQQQTQLVQLLESADEVYENAIQSAHVRRAIARQAAVDALIGKAKNDG